jgi:hypothetical protein
MMAIVLADDIRTAGIDGKITALGGGAKVQIYTAAYGVKLAEFTWTGNIAPGGTAGVATFSTPDSTSVLGLAAGTAAIAKIVNASDIAKFSGLTVGLSAANIVLDTVDIVIGQSIGWLSGALTEGNA